MQATANSPTVGNLGMIGIQNIGKIHIANPCSFYVKPEYRNSHLSKQLIEAAITVFRNNHATNLTVLKWKPGPFEFDQDGKAVRGDQFE